MASRAVTTLVLPVVLIVAGYASSIALSRHIETTRPPLPENYGDSDLQMNGSDIRGYSLGTESLIADWYYMRSLQYIGEKLLNSKSEFINIEDLSDLNPRLLYPYLKNATDLDPHFIAAYTYGALVLPAIDPPKAIELTEQGIANNPSAWRLYQHLGYIYWKLGDYQKAADWYERGSKIAGAAPFMGLMAAQMRSEGGSRDTAREIFNQMLDASDDKMVETTARLRLMELDWLDERDAVNAELAKFRSSNGRCPSDLREIIPALRRAHLPANRDFALTDHGDLADPSGGPYLLDHTTCELKLDPTKTSIAH
jgi:tetratricopeptide (TPR) repeat protein